MARAKMSVVPPAAKGTMILTGRFGQVDCAKDGSANNAEKVVTLIAPSVRDKVPMSWRRGMDFKDMVVSGV
jgi:hypothetical protein